jgi:unsaturated rhamnogalacturonyl hydrolase
MGIQIQYTVFLAFLLLSMTGNTQQSPVGWAKKVANRVIEDASFGYFYKQQANATFPQTIDLRDMQHDGVYYAWSQIEAPEGHTSILGITSQTPVQIWLNGRIVYQQNQPENGQFSEVAYGMYDFPHVIDIELNNKLNTILVKIPGGELARLHMGAILADGFRDSEVSFTLEGTVRQNGSGNWLISGPWQNDTSGTISLGQRFPPEDGFMPYYDTSSGFMTWHFPLRPLIVGHEMPEQAVFRRHPYTEWHYSNGATMWSILRLAEASGEHRYEDFVRQFCEFTLNDYSYFNHQYQEMNEFGGHNMRIFRMSMLDDSSAPALPFIFLYGMGKLDNAWPVIEKAAHQASRLQARLPDNTLCRPEPERWSIWADDLFMYVPFILEYAKITNNDSLVDDAIHQALMFHKYLFDKQKGLYYHGWFSQSDKHSVANWSRANGWVAWAMSELLMNIPENHPKFQELVRIQHDHMQGLLLYQHSSGLWHQVLDHPETYLETSGTALFALSMARGVTQGYLGEPFRNAALKAWDGITERISDIGVVSGICQGTGIGESIEFYQNRQTPPHDPRGLGAVITAGIEIQKLLE